MWAVSATGLYAGNGPFPEGVAYVDEETFNYIRDNFELLNIEVAKEGLKVSVDLVAYKQFAISEIKLADWTEHKGIKVFDHELALVMQLETRYGEIYLRNGLFKGTSGSLASAINNRNRLFHTAVAAINAAQTPPEVDAALESYSDGKRINESES
jgi:hypothetical protein